MGSFKAPKIILKMGRLGTIQFKVIQFLVVVLHLVINMFIQAGSDAVSGLASNSSRSWDVAYCRIFSPLGGAFSSYFENRPRSTMISSKLLDKNDLLGITTFFINTKKLRFHSILARINFIVRSVGKFSICILSHKRKDDFFAPGTPITFYRRTFYRKDGSCVWPRSETFSKSPF